MRRFQVFQAWFRRSTAGERSFAGVSAIIALALFGWLVAPTGGHSTSAGAYVGTGTASTPNCPPGTDQGVTAHQINLAATIVDIKGGVTNAILGIPSASIQKNDWADVASSINSTGGVACGRKIVMHFYDVNPIDPNSAQQACLDIANDHPFLAMDTGSLSAVGASDCIPAHHIPMIIGGPSAAQIKQYYPYYLTTGGLTAQATETGLLALQQQGAFSAANGFHKLGVFESTCVSVKPEEQILNAIVPVSQIVYFDLGCNPQASGYQAAVLKFKSEGVTNVTELGDGSGTNTFTLVAQQQAFSPKYDLADGSFGNGGAVAGSYSAKNLDGALNATTAGYGEENTPSAKPSAATVKCDAIYTAHHLPTVYKQSVAFGGVVCNFLDFFRELVDKAPRLQGNALVDAMPQLGTQSFAFPGGVTDFPAAGKGATYGLSYWRIEQFSASCKCWRLDDPSFHKYLTLSPSPSASPSAASSS